MGLREALIENIARMMSDSALNEEQSKTRSHQSGNTSLGWSRARYYEARRLEKLISDNPDPLEKVADNLRNTIKNSYARLAKHKDPPTKDYLLSEWGLGLHEGTIQVAESILQQLGLPMVVAPKEPVVVKSGNLHIWEARGFTYKINNPEMGHLPFETEKEYFKFDPERHRAHKSGFDRATFLLSIYEDPEVLDAAVKVEWRKANDHKKTKRGG